MCIHKQGIISMLEKGAVIKLLGDSITAGGGSSDNDRSGEVFITIGENEYRRQLGNKCWASLFRDCIVDKFVNSTVVNDGCSGITSTDMKENIETFCKPTVDIFLIMIGTNDRKQYDGMANLYINLIYIVQYLKSKKKKIILMSPNPSTVENENYINRLYHMEDVNNVIARVAEEECVLFISHYNYIQNYLLFTNKTIDEIMLRDEYRTDGLHPSDEVHQLIFRNLVQSLNLGVKVDGATW